MAITFSMAPRYIVSNHPRIRVNGRLIWATASEGVPLKAAFSVGRACRMSVLLVVRRGLARSIVKVVTEVRSHVRLVFSA